MFFRITIRIKILSEGSVPCACFCICARPWTLTMSTAKICPWLCHYRPVLLFLTYTNVNYFRSLKFHVLIPIFPQVVALNTFMAKVPRHTQWSILSIMLELFNLLTKIKLFAWGNYISFNFIWPLLWFISWLLILQFKQNIWRFVKCSCYRIVKSF